MKQTPETPLKTPSLETPHPAGQSTDTTSASKAERATSRSASSVGEPRFQHRRKTVQVLAAVPGCAL